MENKIIKTVAQLGVIAVAIYVVATLLGRSEEATLQATAQNNYRLKHQPRSNSNVNYAPDVVIAPKAEGAPYFQPPVQPLSRY